MQMKNDNLRRRLSRFSRSYVTLDLRDPFDTRKARAARYARKYKTEGRKAVFS